MRGTRYIPYRELPDAAFEIPGVRRTKNGAVLVPWHAYDAVVAAGYTGGFKTLLGRKRIQSVLSFSASGASEDVIALHPFVSEETRIRASPAQREDLLKVLRISGGILDWPTGSGKTLLGLSFATAFGMAPAGRSLVVAPSTTTEQWRRQAKRWLTPEVRVGIVTQGRPTITKRKEIRYILEDGGTARRKLKARVSGPGGVLLRGMETLLLRETWAQDELQPEELTLLRELKTPKETSTKLFLEDDLGAVLGGPFDTVEAARAARGVWTPGDYDVLVVGWGLMGQDGVLDALTMWDPQILVVDEAHRVGKGGSMWRAEKQPDGEPPLFLKKQSAAANLHTLSGECAGAVLLMTATPQGDLPKNWHAILDIYDPYSWGSYYEFGVRYAAGHKGEHGMVYDGLTNPAELKARLRFCWVHRTKAETHKGLPPVRREYIDLDMRAVGRGAVDLAALREELKDVDAGGSAVAAQIAVATEQKIPWAKDRILEDLRSGLKVFVWVALRANARTLRAALSQAALPGEGEAALKVYMGDGAISSVERIAMVEEFITGVRAGVEGSALVSDGQPAVMIGTLGAFGEAIDGLQHVDVAYVLTLPWTPQQLIQGPEGRHSRVGGTRSVLLKYVRLQSSIDDVIWARMGDKLHMVAEVRDDEDAAALGGEIKGDSPEAQARALESLAAVLGEWQASEAAWKDSARVEDYYEDERPGKWG